MAELDLNLLEAGIKRNIAELKKLSDIIDDVAKKSLAGITNEKSTAQISELTKKVQLLEKALIEKLKQDTKEKQLQDQLVRLRNGELDDRLKLQSQLTRERAIKVKNIKESINELTAFQKLAKARNEAQRQVKESIALYGEQDKSTKIAISNFNKLDQAYSRINKVANDGRADVGRYDLATKNLGATFFNLGKNLIGGLGVIGGIQLFASVIKDAFTTIKEFEKSIDTLQAVTNASEGQIASLKSTILDLGKTTKFTSKEVAEASIELAKLGFSSFEIEKSLEGILIGSVALGSQVPETAELVSKTIRAFGLTAGDTERVVSTLAVSANKTATSFQYFADSLPYASTGAKQLGYSVEETATFLGILADNGIQASTAGVSLRDIFSDLSVKGLTLDQALTKIEKSSNKNKTAFELFGKTSQNSAIILANNKDKFDALTKSISNQEVELRKLAEIRSDNLSGDIDKAKGAWEAFILSLEDGNGKVTKIFRGVTNAITDVINELVRLNTTQKATDSKTVRDSNSAYYKNTAKQISDINDNLKKQGYTEAQIFERKKTYLANLKDSEKKYFDSQNNIILKNEAIIKKIGNDIGGSNSRTKEQFNNIVTIDKLKAQNKLARENALNSKGRIQAYKQLSEELINIEKNTTKTTEATKVSSEVDKTKNKNIKEQVENQKISNGLIEKQQKLISETQNKLVKTNSEAEIDTLNKLLELQKKELERLENIGLVKKENIEIVKKEQETSDEVVSKFKDTETDNILTIKKRGLTIEQENEAILKENIEALENEIEVRKAFGENVSQLEIDLIDKKRTLTDKYNAEALAKDKELQEAKQKFIEIATDKIIAQSKKASDKKIELLEKENAESEKQQDFLQELAGKGDVNASKSLALEKENVRKRTQEIEKEKQKQIRTEIVLQGLKVFANNVDQPNAMPKTLTEMLTLITSLSSIQGFYSGTETTVGDVLGYKSKKDAHLVRVDSKEAILNPTQTSELGIGIGRTTSDIVDIVKMHDLNLTGSKVNVQLVKQGDVLVANEIKLLKKEMVNLKTSFNFSIDDLNDALEIKIRNGNKIKTNKVFL